MSEHSFATSFSVDRTPEEVFDFTEDSLRNLIATGEGQPNGRGRPRVPAEELATGRARQRAGMPTERRTSQ